MNNKLVIEIATELREAQQTADDPKASDEARAFAQAWIKGFTKAIDIFNNQ